MVSIGKLSALSATTLNDARRGLAGVCVIYKNFTDFEFSALKHFPNPVTQATRVEIN